MSREESQEEVLGKVVRRIWEEKGGLVNYTQDELDRAIAIAEENERNNPDEPMAGTGDDESITEQEKDDETERKDSKLDTGISPEQMKELKTEISDRLGSVPRHPLCRRECLSDSAFIQPISTRTIYFPSDRKSVV